MQRQVRAIPTQFNARDADGEMILEGYFAVFNKIYEIAPGMTESVAPGAFSNTLAGDVRALTNHDATLVLGRTKAGTLTLREDATGLWGSILINPNDQAAVDSYNRVRRGDVDGCSFGFDIVREDTEIRPDGSTHWTIREVELYEVSCCTFPAYKETNIQARTAERDALEARKREAWKETMKRRIRNGA